MKPKIILFDLKNEFLPLAGLPEVLYFFWDDLRDNILRNISVPLEMWLNILSEIFGYLYLLIPSRNLLLDQIKALFTKWGFTGGEEPCPTLIDLYNFLLELHPPGFSRTRGYLEAVLNRISGLINTARPVFNADKGFHTPELLKHHLIIGMGGLYTEARNFIIMVLMARVYLLKLYNCPRGEKLSTLFIIDEASSIFRRSYELNESPYFLSQIVQTARDFGIGFIFSAQSLSDLSHVIQANTDYKILVGGLGLGNDWDQFARLVL